LVSATGALAQEAPVRIRKVTVDAFPTVSLTFSGEDGLTAEDVTVTESGTPARILSVRPFSAAGEAFDVILAIDTSDSVAGEPLAVAVTAAKSFVEKLPPRTKVGLVTFDDDVQILQPITSDHAAVLSAIDSIDSTQAGTALYDAVEQASKLFKGQLQHNLVLLTDGRDFGSSTSVQDAIKAAKQRPAGVFTIGLGNQADAEILGRIASQTDASYSPAEQANLDAIYAGIAGQLSQQYVVLYRSSAAAGSQVTVAVETSGGGSDQAFVLLPRKLTLAPIPEPSSFPGGFLGLVIVLGLAFVAVFVLIMYVIGGASRLRRDRLLAKRFGTRATQPGAWEDVEEEAASSGWLPESVEEAAEKLAEIGGFRASLEAKLERAAFPMKSGEFITVTILAGLFGLLVGGAVLRNPIFAVILAGVLGAAPYFYLSRKLNSRVAQLHEQLPDVLLIMASSLRAGHSFLQSLDMVAKEIGDPAAPEFSRVVAEVRLGRPVNEALVAMAERVGTEEFKWAIMAVNVQREVGGNLAEILDNVAETVRERDGIRRQIRVLSGEARFSIRILIALPIIVAGLISLVNPDYMRLLWTTRIGLLFIVVGVFLMLIGLVWARKIVKIDV
jgi:tight adherence protein B